jgi:transcriptional regulator with XRE-family HTH domain
MKEEAQKLIGERIRQLREKQGYTPAELASKLEVTETEVCKLEAGQFPPELPYILAALLRILENSILEKWTEPQVTLPERDKVGTGSNYIY